MAVNTLSWPAEVFYRRLHSVVDDYGRYHAHPSLLRAALYPLKLEKVGDSDIGKWIGESCEAGLVRVYSVQDRQYLQVERFDQQIRAKASKFPDPPPDAQHVRSTCAADAEHARSYAYANAQTESYAQSEKAQAAPACPPASPRDGPTHDFPPGFLRVWNETPPRGRDRSSRKQALSVWKKLKLEARADEVHAGMERWKASEEWRKDDGEYVPAFHRWLRDEKWTEKPAPANGNGHGKGGFIQRQCDAQTARIAKLYGQKGVGAA